MLPPSSMAHGRGLHYDARHAPIGLALRRESTTACSLLPPSRMSEGDDAIIPAALFPSAQSFSGLLVDPLRHLDSKVLPVSGHTIDGGPRNGLLTTHFRLSSLWTTTFPSARKARREIRPSPSSSPSLAYSNNFPFDLALAQSASHPAPKRRR